MKETRERKKHRCFPKGEQIHFISTTIVFVYNFAFYRNREKGSYGKTSGRGSYLLG